MDSDMIVMRNMDELMDIDLPNDWIAACHACACNPRKLKHYPADWSVTSDNFHLVLMSCVSFRIPANCAYTPLVHPDALSHPSTITDSSPRPYGLLNSGLVVLTPSRDKTEAIAHYLATSPLVSTFSFPDQDLLAAFYKGKWKPLPWCYNALKTLQTIHKPLWRDEEIRCLHYILDDKPWRARVGEPGKGGEYEKVNRWWWERLEKVGVEMGSEDPQGWKFVSENVASQ